MGTASWQAYWFTGGLSSLVACLLFDRMLQPYNALWSGSDKESVHVPRVTRKLWPPEVYRLLGISSPVLTSLSSFTLIRIKGHCISGITSWPTMGVSLCCIHSSQNCMFFVTTFSGQNYVCSGFDCLLNVWYTFPHLQGIFHWHC